MSDTARIAELESQLEAARAEIERRAAENARLQDGVAALITSVYAIYEQSQAVMRRPSP